MIDAIRNATRTFTLAALAAAMLAAIRHNDGATSASRACPGAEPRGPCH